ncbi:MAG: DNA-binding response regulator [Acidobacteria bacterium]|jgi:two-component system, OmpR family, alkaline phosphatase synthesis response regulator PhoP|nr:MAG: DNA-binding response regulator [Acidobacteriota bacterium]
MNRILLIEDEATLSLLLRERLEKEGYSVAACKDGEQGLAEALREAYDLLLLDIQLPGRNGFEVCRELRRHCMNVPVLMLTARGHVNDRVKGLKTGADDYLIKPFEVAELLARMEALLRRANNSPPQLIDSLFCFGNVVVNLRKQEVLREGSPVELTAREFELLRYFVSHPDELISRDALLKQVWGYQQGLPNTRTVDVHVAQLRQKLELNPKSPRHILTAHRSGYKFIPFP